MTSRVLLTILILSLATVAEGRTWRPVGGRAVLGDFQDVKGTDVIIRTNTGGIETIPYAKLNKKDKEVVNSNLISMGRQSDVERLKNGESSDASSKDGKPGEMAGKEGEETGDEEDSSMRTWTDINGNKLKAELVSVNGVFVQLKTSTGQVQTFPISGFSAADQQYILTNAAAGAAGGVGGLPGTMPGAGAVPGAGPMPGLPAPGFPGAMPGATPGNFDDEPVTR